MELATATSLIKGGIDFSVQSQAWADLGAGKGLFTTALALLLGIKSTVYAVDKDKKALSEVKQNARGANIKLLVKDFIKETTEIGLVDGILMANSLHFVKGKDSFLGRLKSTLKPNGGVIIVEYDLSQANQWIPYPIPYAELVKLTTSSGFTRIEKIGETLSLYQPVNIYSAVLLS